MATGDVLYTANIPVRAIGQDLGGASNWWASFQPSAWSWINIGSEVAAGSPAQVNPFALNQQYKVSLLDGSVAPVSGAIFQRTYQVYDLKIERISNPSNSLTTLTSYSPAVSGDDGAFNNGATPSSVGQIVFEAELPLVAGNPYTLVIAPVS